MKIKHIPKHMKIPLAKNSHIFRMLKINELLKQGYTMPSKYLGGK